MAYKSKAKRAAEAAAKLKAANSASSDDTSEPFVPEVVEDEVEQQTPASAGAFSSLLERAQANLEGGTVEVDKPKKGSWKKYANGKQKEEVATLMASLLTLWVSSWRAPEEFRMTTEEIDAISTHGTNILLRHVNLSGKLTGDALDAIGIIATLSAYYARTRQYWAAQRAMARAERAGIQTVEKEPTAYVVKDGRIIPHDNGKADPVRDIDPGAADWLEERRKKHDNPDLHDE